MNEFYQVQKRGRNQKVSSHVYLTYVQLKRRLENAKPTYKIKLEAYSDGSSRLIRYKNSRVKSNHLLSSPNSCGNSGVIQEKSDDDNKSREIYRIKSKLRGYARENKFDYFWTLTFDPKKCGQSDYFRFTEMGLWLKREQKKAKRRNKEFYYIFVPEYHTGTGENGGTIHWHGVTGGYVPELIETDKIFKGVKVYNCKDWKWGFTNVQRVRSKIKVSNYITKYITKDFANSPARKGKKKYWSSKNLKTPRKSYITDDILISRKADFDSDVCEIYELSADETREYIQNDERKETR